MASVIFRGLMSSCSADWAVRDRRARWTNNRTPGRDFSNMLYYYVFGLFKIAVITQKIYARFVRGATRDYRFDVLGGVVAARGQAAQSMIRA